MTSRAVQVVAIVWAGVAAGIAFAALPNVSDDARIFVAIASVVLPLCAVGAVFAIRANKR